VLKNYEPPHMIISFICSYFNFSIEKMRLTKLTFLSCILFTTVLVIAGSNEEDLFAAGVLGIPLNNLPLVGGGSLTGTLQVTQFLVQGGQLVAKGLLTGVLTDASSITHTITNLAVTLPVDLLQTTGTCQILHLVLGPLNLDLLGLQVTTDRIVADITAQSGSGKLLGNLLCQVAHLLDSGGAISKLVQTLNKILGQL